MLGWPCNHLSTSLPPTGRLHRGSYSHQQQRSTALSSHYEFFHYNQHLHKGLFYQHWCSFTWGKWWHGFFPVRFLYNQTQVCLVDHILISPDTSGLHLDNCSSTLTLLWHPCMPFHLLIWSHSFAYPHSHVQVGNTRGILTLPHGFFYLWSHFLINTKKIMVYYWYDMLQVRHLEPSNRIEIKVHINQILSQIQKPMGFCNFGSIDLL